MKLFKYNPIPHKVEPAEFITDSLPQDQWVWNGTNWVFIASNDVEPKRFNTTEAEILETTWVIPPEPAPKNELKEYMRMGGKLRKWAMQAKEYAWDDLARRSKARAKAKLSVRPVKGGSFRVAK